MHKNTHTEYRSITENGHTKSWKITKEFDSKGALIDYDSTYTEAIAPNQNSIGSDDFLELREYPFGKATNPNMDSFDVDSIMTTMQRDMDKMMSEMNQMMQGMGSMMNQLDFDSFFNTIPDFENMDPFEDRQDPFIFPDDNQKGIKPKGTRT